MQFPSETNLNLLNLWSPPSVPTGAVLKLGGSMSLDNSELSSVPIVTAPLGLMYTPPLSPRVLFSSEANLNLLNLWSPSLVPTGAVLKLAGSIPINRLMPLVRLRCCQWSSTPMFLLVFILTETHLLEMVSAGGPQWRGAQDQWAVALICLIYSISVMVVGSC